MHPRGGRQGDRPQTAPVPSASSSTVTYSHAPSLASPDRHRRAPLPRLQVRGATRFAHARESFRGGRRRATCPCSAAREPGRGEESMGGEAAERSAASSAVPGPSRDDAFNVADKDSTHRCAPVVAGRAAGGAWRWLRSMSAGVGGTRLAMVEGFRRTFARYGAGRRVALAGEGRSPAGWRLTGSARA
jgi:hypothetical protein